uniref:G-protein coupled receptors family 1 profile domain-containing protein n=1 Tax=Anopheles atroparvus TaxID=41427 RepID=A0AAG5CZ77_ANOAO
MLAIDCLVGGLLLSSIGVNILALGAFWVTPSLRTTANRFVINLLIVNLVCCIILGPSLLLNAFTSKAAGPSVALQATSTARWSDGDTPAPTSVYYVGASDGTVSDGTTVLFQRDGAPQDTVASSTTVPSRGPTVNRTRPVKCTKNGTMGSAEIGVDGNGGSNCDSERTGAAESDSEETPFIKTSPIGGAHGDALHAELTLTKIRCWGLDLVVALGALSVLLVVGDTWCAITDPLRYHSRISELKAWGFIIATWVLGIAFGIASGFRGDQKYVTLFKNRLTAEEVAAIESSHWAHNQSGGATAAIGEAFIHHLNISEDLYNTIFSYAYFVIVILVPFALVCAMYWRIFSEARESGQRMRQNGSSPLLQSALNLASAQKQAAAEKQLAIEQQQQQQQLLLQVQPLPSIPEKPCEKAAADGEGLTMKIDKQIHYEDETITISSIPHHHRDSCLKPLLQPTPGTTPTHKPPHAHHEPDRPDRAQVVQIATPTSVVPPMPPSVLKSPLKQDRNHNSTLMALPLEGTVSGPIPTGLCERAASLEDTPCKKESTMGRVRRNHSAGRLVSFHEQQPELPVAGLRQVHSTPNFQKYSAGEFESLGNHHILSLPAVHVPPKALSYMTSIRHRLSNASSLFKYREESRAARISILVIIMFLVSYLPYGILVLMQGHVDLIIVSDQALLAIFTVVIANLSSPFIFAYRNKRVRRGVKRLLGIDKKTNERLQKLTTSNTHFNNHPAQGQQQPTSGQQGNYGANITLAGTAGSEGLSAVEDSGLEEVVSEVNGGGGNCHKSHKVRIAGPGGVGLARSNSSCKYLTPNHAAAVAVANGYIVEFERYPSDELNSLCIQKKSILKRVCDSSRKWGCNFATNSCTSNDEQTEV